jgi:hypothetical protein
MSRIRTADAPFPSQRLAYEGLNDVAESIVDSIRNDASLRLDLKGRYVLPDTSAVNDLVSYYAVSALLDRLAVQGAAARKEYDGGLRKVADQLLPRAAKNPPEEVQESFLATAVVALAALRSAGDLIGMFRSNTSIAGKNLDHDDTALVAAVAERLTLAGACVVEPGAVPLGLVASPPDARAANDACAVDPATARPDLVRRVGDILEPLRQLQQDLTTATSGLKQASDALDTFLKADEAWQANNDLLHLSTDAAEHRRLLILAAKLFRTRLLAWQEVSRLVPDPDGKPAVSLKAEREAVLASLKTTADAIGTTVQAVATFESGLAGTASIATPGYAPLMRAERLAVAMAQHGGLFLVVKNHVLTGSVVTRVHPITGGHLLYTGGAIASFTLFDAASARVVKSGVIACAPEPVGARY